MSNPFLKVVITTSVIWDMGFIHSLSVHSFLSPDSSLFVTIQVHTEISIDLQQELCENCFNYYARIYSFSKTANINVTKCNKKFVVA